MLDPSALYRIADLIKSVFSLPTFDFLPSAIIVGLKLSIFVATALAVKRVVF